MNSPAFVIETHPAWDDIAPAATPPSRYISAFSRAGSNEANISGTPYIFERKICICDTTQITFEENVHVDNQAVLRLYGPGLSASGVLLSSYNTTTLSNFRNPPENDGPVVLTLDPGTYSLQAEMRNDNAGSPMGLNIECTLTADKVAISDHTCCNNGAFVSGFKFLDANCNGIQENTENLDDGWQITLFDALSNPVATTTTDASGYYFFNITTPGTYTIEETPAGPWFQTFPTSPNSHTVTITGSEVISNLNFGNCCPDCLAFQNNAGNIAFTCTSDGLDVSITATSGMQPGDTWSVDINNDDRYELTNIPYGQTATYTFPHAGPFNVSIKAVRIACGEPCEVFLSKAILLEEPPCIDANCYEWSEQGEQLIIHDMCTFDGEIIAGGYENGKPLLASWNGSSWQDYPGIPDRFAVFDVEGFGGYVYAVAINRMSFQQRLYQLVGNLWVPVHAQPLNTNFTGQSQAFVFLSDLERTSNGLFVALFQNTPNSGGSTSHQLFRLNGTSLAPLPSDPSPIGTGTTINYYMIGQYDDEPLVRVDQLDGSFAGFSYLATWSGSAWTALTSTFNVTTQNPVTDNASGITVATQQEADLIVGGSFTGLAQGGPIPGTTGIARWTPGSGFQSIGGGETSNAGTSLSPIHLTGIEVIGQHIFVGGSRINRLGSTTVQNASWFDGTDWNAFNNPAGIYMSTVTATGSDGNCEIYLGGEPKFGKIAICCAYDDLVLSQTETSLKVYHTNGSITSSSTIAAGANVEYKAGNGVFLTPPFTVATGANFLAVAEGCEDCCPPDPLSDLPWMAPFANNNNYSIDQCMYNGDCIYRIADFCQASDGAITYYDCAGNVICEQFQFGGTCSNSFNPTNCTPLQTCPPLRPAERVEHTAESGDQKTDAIDIWISPNPMYAQSTVAFYLPSQAEVLLQLRDLNGNLIQTLQSGTITGGYHQQVFDTSSLPAGMYFLLLTAGPESMVKRIVVLN